jgi:hypothetical protein
VSEDGRLAEDLRHAREAVTAIEAQIADRLRTRDALSARLKALEDAAQECLKLPWDNHAVGRCAAAIRALKDKP